MDSKDYSQGATYWHGTDLWQSTAGSKAYEQFYQTGLLVTDPSHDMRGKGSYSNGDSNSPYKYQTTTVIGKTTFLKNYEK